MLVKKNLKVLALLALPLVYATAIHAAQPLDLNHQPTAVLKSLVGGPLDIVETNRSVFKGTQHIRLQQTYAGVPVWGAEGILHIRGAENAQTFNAMSAAHMKNTSMDGNFYQGLAQDLASTPTAALNVTQQNKALTVALKDYENKIGKKTHIKDQQTERVIFVDKNNKANWAYHVSFFAYPVKQGAIPAKPNYIIDALTLKVYEQWDNIQTVKKTVDAEGGGFGGNIKMGKLIYDGLEGNLPKLRITRDTATKICSLENKEVKVWKCTESSWGYCFKKEDFTLPCVKKDPDHNNVYWNGDTDAVNDGFSPSNDALFNGEVISKMYLEWYGVPVLIQDGKPMLLTMIVHVDMDNAYWDGKAMYFGDGISYFYPLTSLGVAAHEISHGFTTQHSNLTYRYQSGGMNEAFSDMAAQAAEWFAYGKNSWQIGPEIFKEKDKALRYMDMPSKDGRSIDDASQYKDALDVHYTSGVYNRAYYTLGTTKGWDPRKAFDVMVAANSNYWVSSTNFIQGACGALKAAKDLGYDVDAVKNAFDTVKVDTSTC